MNIMLILPLVSMSYFNVGDSVCFRGSVLEIRSRSLSACGFNYWNSCLVRKVERSAFIWSYIIEVLATGLQNRKLKIRREFESKYVNTFIKYGKQ